MAIYCCLLYHSNSVTVAIAMIILLQTFSTYMTFCAIGLTNAKIYEKSLMESRRSRVSRDNIVLIG